MIRHHDGVRIISPSLETIDLNDSHFLRILRGVRDDALKLMEYAKEIDKCEK